MRLREFESDYGTGSTANIATMLNFLKKQSGKKGGGGQISMGALENLMSMSKFGGSDVHSYLDKLRDSGLITDYDENNIYFSDEDSVSGDALGNLPMDDPMGASMDPMGGQYDQLGPNLGEPTDPLGMNPSMAAPGGAPATPAGSPEMQDPNMMMMAPPNPVPAMAARALARRK